MKLCGFIVAAVLLVFTLAMQGGTQEADEHIAATHGTDAEVSLADVQPTPAMWFYVQERRRYEDPRAAVRRKAEYRAQQRQQRIAAMKAFGDSKQRPRVEHSVFYSMFTTRNDHGWPVIWPTPVIEVYQQAPASQDARSP